MRVDKYAAEVLVGGAPLQEFSAARAGQAPPGPGVCVVAYSLHEDWSYPIETEQSDPYGETYTQRWPVTPYSVRVENASAEPAFADVFVDGAHADCVWVGPRSARTVKGFAVHERDRDGHKPFLFSMPAPVRAGQGGGHLQEGVADVATIKVRFKEALNPRPATSEWRPRETSGKFDGVNKNTARLAKSESVSRAGDTVYSSGGSSASSRSYTLYSFGAQKAELVFRYGTVANLKAKGYDVRKTEPPPPGWFAKLKSLLWRPFAAAPASKRKRDDDSDAAPSKKKASSAPPDDDEEEDVIDLT